MAAMKGLGDLEAKVMDILWSASDALSVRQVLEALPDDRGRAYTTVMTVLDNLHRKAYLQRERVGRAWHYRPRRSREAHVAQVVDDALGAGEGRAAALQHFVEHLPSDEVALLRSMLERPRD